MAIQRISSKWAKTKVLLQNEHITAHIPVTRKYSPDALASMLNEFTIVFLKPDIGTYGHGVMCIEQQTQQILHPDDDILTIDTIYQLRYGTETQMFNSLMDLQLGLRPYIHNYAYLIQQGIHLLQYNNRPFDLRVLTQKCQINNG